MSVRSRLGEERGWALVTAIMLMAVMLGVGLTTVSFVDTQQREARAERVRESAFNLADTALSAAAFGVARAWPGGPGAGGVTVDCTGVLPAGTSTANPRCPDASKLVSAFSSAEVAAGATIATTVRDNGPGAQQARYYDAAVASSQPAYDQNGDKRLWLRAQATVGGKTRTIVALVRANAEPVPFPDRVLLAGKIATSNTGNKPIIVTRDVTTGDYAPVSVRCDPAQPDCVMFDRAKGQIAPDTVESEPFPLRNALTEAALGQLREAARAAGTLTSSCPATLTGGVVFIDGPANCAYVANSVFNSQSVPGIVVINNGTLTLGGGSTFYGILYAHNAQDSTGDVITLTGTTQIFGGIMIDGPGRLQAGSSKVNLVYDPAAADNAHVIADGAIVRNSWRELPKN